jgi:carbonic anhydrase
LKLVVVLGHSGCGALTMAVDMFLNPGDYLTVAAKHSIRSILDRTLIVVQTSAKKLQSAFGSGIVGNRGYRQALIETAIVTNAALSAHSIQKEFVANDLHGSRVAYGVYILETREIWTPHAGNVKGAGLAPAPCNPAEFADFGEAIVRSERIISCLKSATSD